MITVSLKSQTEMSVSELSSFAGRMCYTAEVPSDDKQINVEGRLFTPGHHTTLEHNLFNFVIDGPSISSVVFGLHLNSPYYNSDQRSGRFSKMYQNPDLTEIKSYLNHFYPNEKTDLALSFIDKGLHIYHDHIDSLTKLSEQVIREDRPKADDKYIAQNAPKFAQEQLRMFVSQVMPTALITSLDTSALVALWQSAWSPELREITDKMRDCVLSKQPDIAYMFNPNMRTAENWTPVMNLSNPRVIDSPNCQLLSADIEEIQIPISKNAVDILPFTPKAMAQNTSNIKTEVHISCATMGQDQRHRSIQRSAPTITGAFYLPPLLKMAGLEAIAKDYIQDYANLSQSLSPELMTTIAPYGLMVRYEKKANLNALLHEQGKRLCWCAQEEISEIARQLRNQLITHHPDIANRLAPPCYHAGCREGVRFCGRQTNKNLVPDYFAKRRV